MASEYKGLTIQFGADTTKMNSALREAKSVARGTTQELKLLEKGLQLDPSNVTLLAQKQEVLTKKIQATKNELQAYKTLESQANAGTVQLSDSQWTKLKSDITLTTQTLNAYEAELKQLQVQQASASSTIGQAGNYFTQLGEKSESACAKMGSIGSTLTRTVTTGLTLAGTASVVAATKIDTSLTNVKKTVDGTAEDYENLKNAAIEFSKTNAVSASTILDVESLGAQLGYTLNVMSNGKTEVQEFGEVVSGLDIATNMDAETAGSELAQFFNIMQLGKEETKNYASAIVDLGNKNATTESSISAMALRIAGAGKQIGMSGADVLGLSTALSSLGIEAEMGGTAISTIMSNIDKAVALNNDNLQTWAQTAGMTAEEFSEAWNNNAVDALNKVLTGMQSAVDEGGNMSVMLDELGISSLRQTDVMKRLAGGGETLANAISTANTAWEQNTALDNEVANRNDSLAAKFEMLKNRVVAVAEEIGRPLADAMLQAIDAAQPLFTAIENGAKAFSEMSTEEQQTILGFAGMAAALGPVLSVMSKTSSAFSLVGSMLTKVSTGMASLNVEAVKQSSTWTSYGPNIQTATTSMKAHTVATKAGTVATKAFSTALKATVAGLVVAGISALVSAISNLVDAQEKAKTRSDNLKNSQDKLLSSIDAVAGSAETQSTSVSTYAKSFEEVRDSVDECIQKQSDFANSQTETWGQINSSSSYVSSLVDEIAKLSDKEKLTADEQNKLNSKVQEYNSITGDTVSVVDATTGKLSVSTDELKKNADAWKRNAEAQALQERYKTAYENRLEAVEKLQDAEEKLTEAQKALDTWNSSKTSTTDPTMTLKYEEAVRKATDAVNEQKGVVEGYDKVLDQTSQKQVGLTNQTFQASDTFKQLSEQLGMSTEDLKNLCNQYGITGEDATEKFVEGLQAGEEAVVVAGAQTAGKSLDEFKNLKDQYGITGTDSVTAFANALSSGAEPAVAAASVTANMSVDEFKKKCSEYGISGTDDMNAFANSVRNGQGEVIAQSANVAGMSVSQFQALCSQYGISGSEDIQSFANGLRNNGGNAESAARNVANSSKNQLDVDTNSAGQNFSSGFAGGIGAFANVAIRAAEEVGKNALNAIKSALNINSPSKETAKFGEFFTLGFAEGIEDKQKEALKASRNLAEATLQTLDTNMSAKAVKAIAQSNVALQGEGGATTTNKDQRTINIALNYSASDNARTMFNDLVTRLETLDKVKG